MPALGGRHGSVIERPLLVQDRRYEPGEAHTQLGLTLDREQHDAQAELGVAPLLARDAGEGLAHTGIATPTKRGTRERSRTNGHRLPSEATKSR